MRLSKARGIFDVLISGRIARATLEASSVLVIRLLAQAGSLLILARVFGAGRFGLFAGMTALAVMLGTLATFGLHLVLMREVARNPARRNELLVYILPSVLLTGCALLFLYLLLMLCGDNTSGLSIGSVLAFGCAELLVQPLILLASVELQARGHIARSQVLMTLPLVLRFLAALLVWVWAPDEPLGCFAWSYFFSTLLALIVACRNLHEPWPPIHKWRLPRFAELKASSGFAFLNLTAFGPQELDKIIAVRLLPLGMAGTYSFGARIVGAMVLPVVALMVSALPRLFSASGNAKRSQGRLELLIFVSTLGYGLFAALTLGLSVPLFQVLIGHDYAGFSDVLRCLAWVVPGMGLRIAAGNVMMASGRPWGRAGFEVIGILVLFFCALGFAPSFSSQAMPWALFCSEWCMAILGWVCVWKDRRPIPN